MCPRAPSCSASPPSATRLIPFRVTNNTALGTFRLKPGATTLQEVQITAEKPLYAMDGEKMVYNVSDGVRSLATSLLWVSAAMMPFHAFTNCAYFTLRAGGQTTVTFLFDAVFMWVLCIPLAFCLSRFTDLPILPLFMAVTALDLVKCFIGVMLLKKGVWMRNLVNE